MLKQPQDAQKGPDARRRPTAAREAYSLYVERAAEGAPTRFLLNDADALKEPPMLTVETPQDLKKHIGQTLGPSDWITVDQAMIDKFAEATGDHQWIHVDVERAKKEMPDGKTIAHGYLTLSLLPRLVPQLLKVEKRSRGINYGSNKIRFTNTVPAGSRIRLKQTIKNVEDIEGNGVRITSEMVIEVEGKDRPALVAEVMGLQYS
jgi:acyl dehydratase